MTMLDKLSQFSQLDGKHLWWNVVLLSMAIGLPIALSRYGTVLRHARVARAIFFAASLVIGVYLSAALFYFAAPWYRDHIEPHVVITALNAHLGLPLYPDWSRGEGAYGLAYGPFLYAAVGVPLFFSKTVFASKLVAAMTFLFAVAAMWYQARRSRAPFAGIIAQVHVMALILFGFYAFWVRPEPLLLALTAGSVMAIQIRNDTLRWLALGVFAGLAAAIKLHAPLCFVPLGVFALLRAPNVKAAMWCVITGAAAFLLVLIAAFGADFQQAAGFAKYLGVMGQHGLTKRRIIVNLLVTVALTAPFVIALWQQRARDSRTLLTAGSMALCVLLVALVGAKPGGGPHHLIPFIPVLLFFTLTFRASPVIKLNDPMPILAVAMMAGAFGPLKTTIVFLKSYTIREGDIRAGYSEAADLAAAYPGAQFGPTDHDRYPTLQYRVGAALRGARLTFDTAAWQDFDAARIRPSENAADFYPGPLIWILPREGAPFSQRSDYTWIHLFPPVFQAAFKSRCQPIETRKFFTAWRCEAGLLDAAARDAISASGVSP
jgi:hypothetical protein